MHAISRSCSTIWSSITNMCSAHANETPQLSLNDSPSSEYPLTNGEFTKGIRSQTEELEDIIRGHLNDLSASLVQQLQRANTELMEKVFGYEQSLKHALDENASLLQSYNNAARALREYKSSYENLYNQCQQLHKKHQHQQEENKRLSRENEILRREYDSLNARETCQRKECLHAKRRAADLQRELDLQAEQLSKVTTMKEFEHQHESRHDELGREYTALWTRVNIILGKLEEHFDDRFYAKAFLSLIFKDGYERSKKHVYKLIINTLDELHKVQLERQMDVLENTSRIYGLLLHCTQARTEDVQRKSVCIICEEIKQNFPSPSAVGARETLKSADLPLEKVVEVAWKFVTQPCPIIVDQPPIFSEGLHDTNSKHWDEDCKDFELIYARPVVYRSYHGTVLNRALVGNK